MDEMKKLQSEKRGKSVQRNFRFVPTSKLLHANFRSALLYGNIENKNRAKNANTSVLYLSSS